MRTKNVPIGLFNVFSYIRDIAKYNLYNIQFCHYIMLIHIVGPSGSGKTTLGLFFKSITTVIDTDDIDDKNMLNLLKKYDRSKNMKKFNKLRKQYNNRDIKKILEDNKGKDIIFVGFLFSGMNFLSKKFDYKFENPFGVFDMFSRKRENKFAINIDVDLLFRQYNLRTLESIADNIDGIRRLYNNNMSTHNITDYICHKYKIRRGFGDHILNFKDQQKRTNKHVKSLGYKLLYADDIKKCIKELI